MYKNRSVIDTKTVNGQKVEKSNLCASVGFLLTLLNATLSFAFIMTDSKWWLLIFSSSTALLSLILCISGRAVSRRAGKGKIISIIGIVTNAVILGLLLAFSIYLIIGMQSSSQV